MHMNTSDNTPPAPWYKQPWLWFILAPLIAVFFYGTFFLYLSIVTHDGIVKDDMYKIARGHHVDSSKAEKAKELNLSASLMLDNVTGDLMLEATSNQTEMPEFLTLSIIHPTHQQYDQKISLKHLPDSQAYLGSLQNSLKGKRYLILEDSTNSWRLRAEITPPYDQNRVELKPSN